MQQSLFYMWGERGIVATFFADMHLFAAECDWAAFLNSIETPACNFPRHTTAATAIIEPDFGNKGFGHPDAVLILEEDEKRFVVVFEAKRKPYARSCGKVRGEKGYNSTLKGQLELNYVLAVSLSTFGAEYISLTEPEWIANTPYALGRDGGHRAVLKNEAVMNAYVRKLSELPLENYFHVVLTTDTENPLIDPLQGKLLPEIYQASDPSRNVWTTARNQFGWLNYECLKTVAAKLRRPDDPRMNLFAASFGFNLANMSKKVGMVGTHRTKKTVLVYIPDINAESYLHCSYQGDTCKLRDYTKSRTTDPIADARFKTEQVLRMAVPPVLQAVAVRYTNVQFWHDEIRRQNALYLAKNVTNSVLSVSAHHV